MLSRSPLVVTSLAAALVGTTAATAQTPVRLYSLIVNDGTTTPSGGTETRTLTGVTANTGGNLAELTASVLAISDGIGAGNELTFNGGGGFSTFVDIGRFNNPAGRGVLIYDLNLNDTTDYNTLELDLGINQGGGGTGVEVFVSYNDVDAGLSLDTDLNTGFTDSGVAIGTELFDATEYTRIAGPTTATGTQIVDGFSLDAIRAASDDGLLRIAIGVDGFRRDITVLNNATGVSQITGVLVPEPGSLSLVGLALGGVSLLRRRRGNA